MRPFLQIADFLSYPYTVEGVNVFSGLSVLTPCMTASLFDLITCPKPHILVPSFWGLGIQHMDLGTHIQSITVPQTHSGNNWKRKEVDRLKKYFGIWKNLLMNWGVMESEVTELGVLDSLGWVAGWGCHLLKPGKLRGEQVWEEEDQKTVEQSGLWISVLPS